MKVYENGQIKYKKVIRSEQPIKKIYFTAPEIARLTNEKPFVIRFWAKQFEVYRKAGSHTWQYPRASVALFHQIKYLLRIERYTIEGAKLKLKTITV